MRRLALFAAAALLLGLPAAAQTPTPAAPVTVNFAGGDGSARGTATLTPGPNGVLIRLAVTGLTPGWHGIHLHKVGLCEGPGFTNAGSHVNSGAMQHGLMNAMGAEDGDLPNIHADAAGAVVAEMLASKVSLAGEGGRTALRDADGSAIVIHAMPDDLTTPPIGGSGGRVACAAIPKG
ncbi:superoxide dismutase family protein [soil metagenome]